MRLLITMCLLLFSISVFSQKIFIENQNEKFIIKGDTVKKYYNQIDTNHLNRSSLVDVWYSNKTGLYFINFGLTGAYTLITLIVRGQTIIDQINWDKPNSNYHTKLYSVDGETIYLSNGNLYVYNNNIVSELKNAQLEGEKNFIIWGLFNKPSPKILIQSTRGREFIKGKYYTYDLTDETINFIMGTIESNVKFLDHLNDYPITDQQISLINNHRPIFKSTNILIQVNAKIIY